jgi:hypothetical protein
LIVCTALHNFLESSRVEADTQKESRGHITEAAQAAIKAIRAIVSRPPIDETFEQWASIIRSSLLSLLKMAEGTCLIQWNIT